MERKDIKKNLNALIEQFKSYENDCYKEMAYMRKHNLYMEEAAIRYKQEAYNKCWLELANLVDNI